MISSQTLSAQKGQANDGAARRAASGFTNAQRPIIPTPVAARRPASNSPQGAPISPEAARVLARFNLARASKGVRALYSNPAWAPVDGVWRRLQAQSLRPNAVLTLTDNERAKRHRLTGVTGGERPATSSSLDYGPVPRQRARRSLDARIGSLTAHPQLVGERGQREPHRPAPVTAGETAPNSIPHLTGKTQVSEPMPGATARLKNRAGQRGCA